VQTFLQKEAKKEAGLAQSSEQIWHDYHASLFSFIRQRVGDRALAEDLLQEVFLKIHARLHTLNDAERLSSWIYQIARHTIIDHYRVAKPVEPLPGELVQPLDQNEQEWQELGRCVQPMIALLPAQYREAVQLFEIEGLSLKEVAARQGVSLTAAKSRVQRGREKLKEIFLDCCRMEFDCRGKLLTCSPKDPKKIFRC
jgi:RNA polymerase sigma-70 factor, ECF subfamily